MIFVYDNSGEKIGSFDPTKASVYFSVEEGMLYFTASNLWVWGLPENKLTYIPVEEVRDWFVTTNNTNLLRTQPDAAKSLGLRSYSDDDTPDGYAVMRITATIKQRSAYLAEANELDVSLDDWITSALDAQLTLAGNMWTYLDENGVEITWPETLA